MGVCQQRGGDGGGGGGSGRFAVLRRLAVCFWYERAHKVYAA
jgi:hypothetical protein